ncbi:STAS domain protein [mine drainage metagenome]|uniref:STAS domain protein n=1 Tax=mine drainage metagenome TaxID=410659 RepID=A0A1J5R582_9ZZZZ
MEYEIRDRDGLSEIFLKGRLTFDGNAEFRRMLQALDAVPARVVALDLADLEYMDTTGMGMILLLQESVVAKGGSLSLRHQTGEVGRMLTLCRFGEPTSGLHAN